MKSKSNTDIKIAVGLSGGVDSSVTALLLQKEGYDITGVYIKCWDEKMDGCTSAEDRASAVSVASHLGIKFEALDFEKEYNQKIIDYFYAEYEKGRTPNPDILCNKDIKFGMFLDWAIENGFDYIATGHYAQVEHGELSKLIKGKDDGKDQSYFLYRLDQDQLARSMFPLGKLDKSEVRKLAKEADLSTHDRPDSQGICFVGKVDIKDFLMQRIKPKKGKLYHVNGKEIGEHDGVWFYTIGQRHGFKLNKYFGLPLYVVGKDVEKNHLYVGYVKDVLKREFVVEDLHWVSGAAPEELAKGEFAADVRIRHLGEMYKAEITQISEDRLNVQIEKDIFGVAPGQSAVFYEDNVVLGGGIIE